jgi:2-isopropylmalate synthase
MRQTYEIIDPRKIGRGEHELVLGKHSGRHAFKKKLESLGYSLSEKAFDETFTRFKKLADAKKNIYDEDLESLVEDQLTQVPEIWTLQKLSLQLETGEKPHAQIEIKKKGKTVKAVSTGDGPVDACYRAVDKITKVHSKLLQYSIQAVTPGEDALGEVMVKLEVGGNEIVGRGSSTDVIEASVKAYLNALNRAKSRQIPKKTLRPPGRLI